MRKPTIDELLDQVGGIYELTMLAAREARRIRLKDKEAIQPLQTALDRIAQGKVKGKFLSEEELARYDAEERSKRELAQVLREKQFSHVVTPPPILEEKE
jgi:DNA-directed RNA polymerase omega subunit